MAENKGDKTNGQGDENSQNPPNDSVNSDSNSGGNSGDGGTGTKDDHETLREMVREEIKAALKDAKPEDGGGIPRRQDIEGMAERMVREAAERLEKNKQHEADHENLRNGGKPPENDTPISEDVPKRVRKLTKLLWGEGD